MIIETNIKYKTRSGKIVILESFKTLSSGRVYQTTDCCTHLYNEEGISLHNDPENDIVELY